MIQTTPGRYHGHATLSLPNQVEAGSTQDFRITFTVGDFGVDDSGSLKLCWRFASDIGTPQFDDPAGPNFLEVRTSADCELHPRFDPKGNTRPWGRTVYVKVQKGFLEPGDRVEFIFHSAQLQTFVERDFRFRFFVDDAATYVYNEVEVTPRIDIVPGPADRLRLYLPSSAKPGEPVELAIVAEDRWANPTVVPGPLKLSVAGPLSGVPDTVAASAAAGRGPAGGSSSVTALRVPGLRPDAAGTVRITASVTGPGGLAGGTTFESNPLVVDGETSDRLAWGDMHGQSGETIGTGTVDQYFRFARDLACVDFASHQGNDFQITREFWSRLQGVTSAFNEDGRFVTFPGYEWSGNSALGGDHNVYFRTEGRHIRRSSHALCPDLLDAADDCTTIEELFAALANEECLVVPHVGGRYADLARHDPSLERSVEVHSAWGTFEWMIHDALRHGHVVGIVATSDGHKGRPGASHPGRGHFGSYGGLTCVLVDELTRDEVWNAFKSRRHYATTGARTYLSLHGELVGGSAGRVGMGDRVDAGDATAVRLAVRYAGTGPVLAVDVFNGLDCVDHRRAAQASASAAGDRILVWWSGSLKRGRGRHVDWTGFCEVENGKISEIQPVNFHNPDRPLRHVADNRLEWESITTGGMSGFIGRLSNPHAGFLRITTERLEHTVDLSTIEDDEISVPAGGVDARLQVMRLPSQNTVRELSFEADYRLLRDRRNALYVRVTQEDGTVTWSSPIYVG